MNEKASQVECFYCQKPATERCDHCQIIWSCGPDHLETFHYAPSSGRCFPFIVRKSEEKGIHVVAARDIRPMEVILEEYPAAVGPYVNTAPLCLSCLKPIQEEVPFTCSKCQYPMCDSGCAEEPVHKRECQLFGKVGVKPNLQILDENGNCSDYSAITALRLFSLKETKPLLWESLQELLDHCKERYRDNPGLEELLDKKVVSFIRDRCKITDFSRKEIHRILGLMSTNNADLNLTEGKGTGLYVTFARLNHSCICNTKSIKFHNQRLEVRASMAIQKGEEITNQYVKPNIATVFRRPILWSKWHFECRCRRCCDPTELGSYLSALLCHNCHGPVLPKEPLDFHSIWVCQKCNDVYELDYVSDVLQELSAVLEESEDDLQACSESLAVKCEEILHTFSNRLHPNHQKLVELQMKLAFIYGNTEPFQLGNLSRMMLDRKIQTCLNILDAFGPVDPGYSTWRGKILMELNKAKMFKAQRDFNQNLISAKAMQDILNERKFLAFYLAYYKSIFFGLDE